MTLFPYKLYKFYSIILLFQGSALPMDLKWALCGLVREIRMDDRMRGKEEGREECGHIVLPIVNF